MKKCQRQVLRIDEKMTQYFVNIKERFVQIGLSDTSILPSFLGLYKEKVRVTIERLKKEVIENEKNS